MPGRTAEADGSAMRFGLMAVVGGGLFLQGFEAVWERVPHRLSALEIAAGGDVGADGRVAGRLEAEMRGGSWASGERMTDVPHLQVRYGSIASEGLGWTAGRTDLVLSGGRREDLAAEATERVRVDVGDLGADAAVAVWLTGFELRMLPEHPDGFTPNRIAVTLGEPIVADGRVEFDVYARFDGGPVPDRAQALAEYGSTMGVEWAVVVVDHGEVRRFTARSGIDQGPVPIALEVPAGLPGAVAGLSGFSFDVRGTGGRYVRAVGVGLIDGAYDAARGSYGGTIAFQLDNAGMVARPVHADAEAVFTWVGLPVAAEVHQGHWAPDGVGQRHEIAIKPGKPVELVREP